MIDSHKKALTTKGTKDTKGTKGFSKRGGKRSQNTESLFFFREL
jgi:hypothetical protein